MRMCAFGTPFRCEHKLIFQPCRKPPLLTAGAGLGVSKLGMTKVDRLRVNVLNPQTVNGTAQDVLTRARQKQVKQKQAQRVQIVEPVITLPPSSQYKIATFLGTCGFMYLMVHTIMHKVMHFVFDVLTPQPELDVSGFDLGLPTSDFDDFDVALPLPPSKEVQGHMQQHEEVELRQSQLPEKEKVLADLSALAGCQSLQVKEKVLADPSILPGCPSLQVKEKVLADPSTLAGCQSFNLGPVLGSECQEGSPMTPIVLRSQEGQSVGLDQSAAECMSAELLASVNAHAVLQMYMSMLMSSISSEESTSTVRPLPPPAAGDSAEAVAARFQLTSQLPSSTTQRSSGVPKESDQAQAVEICLDRQLVGATGRGEQQEHLASGEMEPARAPSAAIVFSGFVSSQLKTWEAQASSTDSFVGHQSNDLPATYYSPESHSRSAVQAQLRGLAFTPQESQHLSVSSQAHVRESSAVSTSCYSESHPGQDVEGSNAERAIMSMGAAAMGSLLEDFDEHKAEWPYEPAKNGDTVSQQPQAMSSTGICITSKLALSSVEAGGVREADGALQSQSPMPGAADAGVQRPHAPVDTLMDSLWFGGTSGAAAATSTLQQQQAQSLEDKLRQRNLEWESNKGTSLAASVSAMATSNAKMVAQQGHPEAQDQIATALQKDHAISVWKAAVKAEFVAGLMAKEAKAEANAIARLQAQAEARAQMADRLKAMTEKMYATITGSRAKTRRFEADMKVRRASAENSHLAEEGRLAQIKYQEALTSYKKATVELTIAEAAVGSDLVACMM